MKKWGQKHKIITEKRQGKKKLNSSTEYQPKRKSQNEIEVLDS